jgi:hypothetical protein
MATDRADILVAEQTSMVVPATYFDQLVASLDEPDDALRLARAAQMATTHKRIKAARAIAPSHSTMATI